MDTEVMDVMQRAVEAVAARAPRVSTVIKADWRPEATDALQGKVEALETYLTGSVGEQATRASNDEAPQPSA